MKKFSLFAIIDFIFKFAILFCINLIWSLYFIKTIWLSFLISAILSVFVIFLFKFISNKKHSYSQIKLNETKHLENTKATFIYMPQNEILDFFLKLAQIRHEAKIVDDYILINNKTVLYPNIKYQELKSDKIIEIYNSINKNTIKKIIILCNKKENNIDNITDNFKIKTIVLDYNQTYTKLLKEYDFFPKIEMVEKRQTKKTFKQFLQIIFNKKRTRGYIVSSLFIIFSSFFVMYRVYYLIIATVLLIFALVCQFEYKFNKITPESLLD